MGGSPKHSEFCTTSKMAVSTKAPTFLGQIYQTMRRVAYNASGFNKYGLMHDDVLYETPDVEEALRRLPTKLMSATSVSPEPCSTRDRRSFLQRRTGLNMKKMFATCNLI